MGRGEGDSAEEEGKAGKRFSGEFLDTVDRADEWEICGVKDCVVGEYITHTLYCGRNTNLSIHCTISES